MKSVVKFLVLALALAIFAPLSAFAADKKIIVGATPFPHADILKIVKPLLAKEGYDLEVKEFNDYVTPNIALNDGSLTANFFQHVPYLDDQVKEHKYAIEWVAKVHIEPIGLYSSKVKGVKEIKDGSTIAVPNDPTNGARALRLLEKTGLIKVKAGELVTAKDITSNPKKLKIVELEAPQLPRSLPDVEAAVINTNFAIEGGLNPTKDALFIEDKDSPYSNVLVVRTADKNKPEIKALVKAINSPEVKKYIVNDLAAKGIVPAF
ncbi:lipoprotein [Synergistales bacterium]|nr:lipoprotein [Synergistales bacterium]